MRLAAVQRLLGGTYESLSTNDFSAALNGRLRRSALRPVWVVVAFAVVVATIATTSSPAVAAPAVAWQIKQETNPTILPPGPKAEPRLRLQIVNVGGAVATSGVTITDKLSAGATPLEQPASHFPGFEVDGLGKGVAPCSVAGQEVSCEVKELVPAGGQVDVYIPVTIEPNPPAVVTSEVRVSSPGTNSASDLLRSPTGENAPSFEFVESQYGLSASAFDEAGSIPAAGSHPFDVEMSANEPSTVAGGRPQSPVERLRSLRLELPAGLIANPLAATARCTPARFRNRWRKPPFRHAQPLAKSVSSAPA